MYYKFLIRSTSTKLAEKYTITATIHFRFVIGNFSEKRPTPLLSSRPKAIREEWNVRRDILFSIKTYLQSKKSNSFTKIGQKKKLFQRHICNKLNTIHSWFSPICSVKWLITQRKLNCKSRNLLLVIYPLW